MSKFSVKKPLTVFVAVIAILVLGVVSYINMTPDLLPNMDFPYVLVMTTYPGASPEKVEEEIVQPMERAMSTLDHLQEVNSVSSENVGMVILQFTDSVNMDTIGVDIQQEISQISSGWADTVGTPYVLKINPSMLPVEVAAVSMEGMDTMALTDFLNDKLMNKLEGIPGVARISTTGAVEQELHVVLDQKMIDNLNSRIAAAINGELDDAAAELTEKKDALEDAQKQVNSAQAQLYAGQKELTEKTAQASSQLSGKQAELEATKTELQNQKSELQSTRKQVEVALTALQSLQSGIDQLDGKFAEQNQQLDSLIAAQSALDQARARAEQDIQAIQANEELSEEEKAAQTAAAEASLQAELSSILAGTGYPSEEALSLGINTMETGLNVIQQQIATAEEALASQGLRREALASSIAEMEGNLSQIDAGIAAIDEGIAQIDSGMLQLKDAQALLDQQNTSGILQIRTGAAKLAVSSASISQGLSQIESGLDTIEDSRETALDKADLNGIVTMEMVSKILAAQNFSMPAGYVEQDGIKYMVSVGDEITDQKTLENLLLFDPGIDGIDPVRLKDVAVVMLTDTRDETYAKLNGSDGIVLSFEKQSTYATAETTNNISDRFRELEAIS